MTGTSVPSPRTAPAAPEPSPDELPDGLLVADEHGRIVVFNRMAERSTGIGREHALGREAAVVLPLTGTDGSDWWKTLDPYGGLNTRTRHPEQTVQLAGGREVLVTAVYRRDSRRRV